MNYSCIQGWTGSLGGVGNFGLDPLLVDPDGPDDVPGTEDDDLRLRRGSPAVDSGSSAAVPPDVADLDGDADTAEPVPYDLDLSPRIADGNGDGLAVVDLGAYEFQGGCGSDLDCTDDDPCTIDECDVKAGECVSSPVECPPGQVCRDGHCVKSCVSALDCDDRNSCTADLCNPGTRACSNTPIKCRRGEICVAGQCRSKDRRNPW